MAGFCVLTLELLRFSQPFSSSIFLCVRKSQCFRHKAAPVRFPQTGKVQGRKSVTGRVCGWYKSMTVTRDRETHQPSKPLVEAQM